MTARLIGYRAFNETLAMPNPKNITRTKPDTAIYDKHGKHIANCSYWDLSQDMHNYLKSNGYYFGSLAVAKRIAARRENSNA